MVEEYPVEPTDPQPPKTGDDFQIWFWLGLMIMSFCAIMILRFAWKNDKREE
jgi:LPXTG-motif cell wall-anchored protein